MKIKLKEEDLKEIFSLFCSCTKFEKNQIYDENSEHYFKNVNLKEEYELNQPVEEFSFDAFRSILYFLYSKGFTIAKDNHVVELSYTEDLFYD